MPESDEQDPAGSPVVHVLIGEEFFRERVSATLRALAKEPSEPGDWDDELAERLASRPALGVVADLEEPSADVVGVLRALRQDPRTEGWTYLAYCSHDREELGAAATELGVQVVPRSTFASSLVRLLQGFRGPGEGGGPADEEA